MGGNEGRRILVVEDEPIVAISLQDMLEELGYSVVGPAFRLAAALALAESEAFDVAILDVNMGDGESYPVAALLRARGVPYVFATGYGREGLEPGHDQIPVLRKPYHESQLAAALEALLG
jgi:CheY-like chemotaxis protein